MDEEGRPIIGKKKTEWEYYDKNGRAMPLTSKGIESCTYYWEVQSVQLL